MVFNNYRMIRKNLVIYYNLYIKFLLIIIRGFAATDKSAVNFGTVKTVHCIYN